MWGARTGRGSRGVRDGMRFPGRPTLPLGGERIGLTPAVTHPRHHVLGTDRRERTGVRVRRKGLSGPDGESLCVRLESWEETKGPSTTLRRESESDFRRTTSVTVLRSPWERPSGSTGSEWSGRVGREWGSRKFGSTRTIQERNRTVTGQSSGRVPRPRGAGVASPVPSGSLQRHTVNSELPRPCIESGTSSGAGPAPSGGLRVCPRSPQTPVTLDPSPSPRSLPISGPETRSRRGLDAVLQEDQ